MSDVWRYRFYQVQNGLAGYTSEQYLFDLPLNSATFSTVLQQSGTWSGTVQMTDSGVQRILANQPPLHTLEDRTAMYVELNGDLVFGGPLQQVSYDSITQTAKIQGMDWWGYFNQGRQISWNASYTNADQLLVAADLMNIAQGAASTASASPTVPLGFVTGGAVGVILGSVAAQALTGAYTSGVDVTVAWAQSANKSLGQAISDMAVAAFGFDWTIDVAYSGGVPTKTFNLWYPRAGRTQQQQITSGSSLMFNLGGTSGQKYTWPSGQVQPANVLFGAGSGAGNSAIASEAADPTLLAEGWPVLENNVSFTDVNSQSLLDSLTLATLNATKLPVSQPQIQYNAGSDSDQPLGAYAIGDDCRLMIPPDPYFPSGYDSEGGSSGENWWRVQQITTTVNDQGKSYSVITLGLPPIIPGT